MINWVERLTGETRAKLLNLLRRSRQTITGLADGLGLTDNAVRTHVAALERDGIVEQVGTQRDTGGKPRGDDDDRHYKRGYEREHLQRTRARAQSDHWEAGDVLQVGVDPELPVDAGKRPG